MRHLSQKLRDVLLLGDGPGEELIQAELVEFKSVRIGKYKQELKDVFKEFQEIAMNALEFEDCFLDSEFNKLTQREMKVFLEKSEKGSLMEGTDENKTVKLEDDDKIDELKKAEKMRSTKQNLKLDQESSRLQSSRFSYKVAAEEVQRAAVKRSGRAASSTEKVRRSVRRLEAVLRCIRRRNLVLRCPQDQTDYSYQKFAQTDYHLQRKTN